jgi:hypothetical protein
VFGLGIPSLYRKASQPTFKRLDKFDACCTAACCKFFPRSSVVVQDILSISAYLFVLLERMFNVQEVGLSLWKLGDAVLSGELSGRP